MHSEQLLLPPEPSLGTMGIEIEGLDELQKELEKLTEQAENLHGENEVPMDELFTNGFMQTHTDFESLEEFFSNSPWEVETKDDFNKIPQSEFDAYVTKHTGFNDWDAMLSAAGREWITRQLGLNT